MLNTSMGDVSPPLTITAVTSSNRCTSRNENMQNFPIFRHSCLLMDVALDVGVVIEIARETFYNRAKPAAAPIAATTISLLQLTMFAAPVKGAGLGEVNVPFELGAGAPVEATVGAWI